MRTISATVGAEITLKDPGPGVVSRLRRALRYSNPEYTKACMRGGIPDDEIDQYCYACTELPNGDICLPRGAVQDVKMVAALKRAKIQWQDERGAGEPLDCRLTLTDGGELRDYQAEGVDQIEKYLQGMIVLPCGGGKTYLGMGAIHRIARSTLVIVPTTDLLHQWAEDARNVLGVEPAIFGDGKHQIGPLTIATKAALCHPNHQGLDLSRFGFVLFDECHRVAARTCQELLRRIPARYRLGLTATPDRADGTTKLVRYSFGDTLLERTVDELVDDGWLVLPEVEAVFTSFQYRLPEEPSFRQLNKLTDALMNSDPRNATIAQLVGAEPNETWLILCPSRTLHCHILAALISNRYKLKTLSVTGEMSKKKRRIAMQAFRDGELQVMCATSLADEGLNIKRLSRIVLALPESSRRGTTQRLGRCMRPFGAKTPKVYDVVDIEVGRLKKRWQTRKSAYRKLGLEINECPTLSLFSTATA